MTAPTFQMLLMGAPAIAKATFLAGTRDTVTPATSHNYSLDCGIGGNVVVALSVGTGTISSVTIGGQTATVVQQITMGGSGIRIALAAASGCPSGVQTIAVTMSTINGTWDGLTYQLEGVVNLTPTSSGNDSHVTGGCSGTLSNPANGCTIGYTGCSNGGAVTWNGLTLDLEVGTGVGRSASAHQNFTAANAALAWSTSFGGSNNQTAAVWASWGPT